MEAYLNTMDSIGESILNWADPDNQFRGYTEGWFLTDFRTAGSIALAYVAFVVIGSAVMKSGVAAMDPYPIKFFYNVSQIMLCAYMTIEGFLLAYRNGYTCLPCIDIDTKNPPLANLLWLFYVSKVWDFWDTIFIVLGKKWRQLSFLHVYHHTTIFLFYWLNAHVNFDGDIYLTIVLNGFIHTVMYTYYFICMHTKDPKTGKSLPIWWKSSLTLMQLIQFITMMSQATYLLVTGCQKTGLRVVSVYFVYILSLFFLFAQFYVASYTKKPKKKAA
uniref:Elongation of fatty acids protein n=2 Tax=Odontella aurita TaxID=265563 RepID=A0A7S4JGP6_9STRA